ncbi:MAG: hypothetical protein DRI26_07345 [Chloroflexi bacterium]|nr:MAG: hypothetical protein DRI26_07345 [Chloroflexota bacterium]
MIWGMADYVFRYKLDGKKETVYQDPLLDMIRAQLENILNIIIPVEGQREVKIDGFKLLRDRKTVYKVFPQEPDSLEERSL